MKAMYTSKGDLLIREGGEVLAMRPVPTEDPRALVDNANARLLHVSVQGDDAAAWRVRRTLAENVISELAA